MNKNEFQWTDQLVIEYSQHWVRDRKIPSLAIEEFKNLKQRKPLFTTEDGVDIFEDDEYFYVSEGYIIFRHLAPEISPQNKLYSKRTFSTKQAAENYILMNKPVLSVNDVLSCTDAGFHPSEKTIKENDLIKISKSKIQSNQ